MTYTIGATRMSMKAKKRTLAAPVEPAYAARPVRTSVPNSEGSHRKIIISAKAIP